MKNFVLFVFYLFVTSHFFGQKPIVKLEIEPRSVQIGDEIVVTVKTNVQGEIDIDFPSAFVNGYAVMNGMEQEMDYNTGRVISLYYYSQNPYERQARRNEIKYTDKCIDYVVSSSKISASGISTKKRK